MSDPVPLDPQQEERLARYRAGVMTEAERADFEREAVASGALSEELYAELALDDLRPAVAARAGRRGPAAWTMHMALPIAATLAAFAAAGWWWTHPREIAVPGQDVMRGRRAAAGLLEPSGTLDHAPSTLRWNHVAGADHYRVELFDGEGHSLGAAVTADTLLAVDSLAASPPGAGEWRVVPIDSGGREGTPLGRAAFRVRGR